MTSHAHRALALLSLVSLCATAPSFASAQDGQPPPSYAQPPPAQQPPPSAPPYAQPAPQPQPYAQPQPYPQPYPQPSPQPYYAQPQPYAQPAPPPQTRTEMRPNLGLVITGAVMLAVSWIIHGALISPFAGYSLDLGFQDQWATFRATGFIPLAGPWVQLAVKPNGTGSDGWGPYLVVDGVLQAAGLTMLILGLVLQEEHTVVARADAPSFAIAPMIGPALTGLAASGRF